MVEYFRSELGILYLGDVILRNLPDGSVDLVIADPQLFVKGWAEGGLGLR